MARAAATTPKPPSNTAKSQPSPAYRCNTELIKLVTDNEQPKDATDEEITGWILAKCEATSLNKVWEWLDQLGQDKIIQRLFTLKITRKGRQKTVSNLNTTRPQAITGMLAYLLIEQDNVEPCKTCASEKSTGPAIECLAGTIHGKVALGGSCTNCEYSGTASSCSLRQLAEKQTSAKKRTASSKDVIDQIIEGMTLDTMKEFKKRLDKEIMWRKKQKGNDEDNY